MWHRSGLGYNSMEDTGYLQSGLLAASLNQVDSTICPEKYSSCAQTDTLEYFNIPPEHTAK